MEIKVGHKEKMKIVIFGAGKMGGWLAHTLAADGNEVLIYDIDQKKAMAQVDFNIYPSIHNFDIKILHSLAELSTQNPKLLINAVSLQNTLTAFDAALPYLSHDCVLVDVASIKAGIEDYYKKSGFRFASVHPMFGPTFVNMESLREENAVIIKDSDPAIAMFFRKFFERLGVHIFEYSFEEHDRMMAYTLTTPFVASLVFAACVDKTSVPGTTFKRHREVARGLLAEDDHLIAEILFNKYSVDQLNKMESKIEYLKHIIKGKDKEEAKKFFDKMRKNI